MEPVTIILPIQARTRNTVYLIRDEIHKNFLPFKEAEELLSGRFKIEVNFYFLGHSTGDIDNLLKPTLDFLKRTVVRDDNQFKEIHSHLYENSGQIKIEIILTEIPKTVFVRCDCQPIHNGIHPPPIPSPMRIKTSVVVKDKKHRTREPWMQDFIDREKEKSQVRKRLAFEALKKQKECE